MIFSLCCVAIIALAAAPVEAAYPPPVEAKLQMVVSAQHLASKVGDSILNQGGNAVDAAVAVGYALAVVHPCCGNLGGGGFMTLHVAQTGKDIFLNFREKAPLAATEDMFINARGEVDASLSRRSYLAVGVPGTVLGLDTALHKFGSMSRQQVMQPAIELAEQGYVLTAADANILGFGAADFAKQPNVEAIFLANGQPPKAGDRIVQSELAHTLKLIAKEGPDAFYKGPIARAIVDASTRHGGVLSMQDFAEYTVEESEPVGCSYRGYEVVSSAPPSSGGTTICLILNVLEGYPLGFLGFNSSAGLHLMVEAMRHAFVDRNNLLGDPDFVDNPLERLLSEAYARELRAKIRAFSATPSAELGPGVAPHEEPNTTHISIVDKQGNAVGLTYTINSYFGSRRIAGDTGFFLNNEMDDFTASPGAPNMFGLVQGRRNAIAPGKRPLSSMSPTLVKKDGKIFLVLGSPGGSRIISIVVQGIINVVDHGMDISEAVNAPRIHHQWLPDRVFAEPRAINRDALERLETMGHRVSVQRSWGAMEAIMVVPETDKRGALLGSFADDTSKGRYQEPGIIYGVNDSRRPAGLAIGR